MLRHVPECSMFRVLSTADDFLCPLNFARSKFAVVIFRGSFKFATFFKNAKIANFRTREN